MRKLFLFFLSHILITFAFAQNKNLANGVVKGVILEEKTQSPLPYATVSIRDSRDSLIVGVIADDAGVFLIDQIPHGNFILEIRYTGFLPYTNSLSINGDNQKIDLGTVTINENSIELDEVVVRGEVSEVSLRLDKKVFTVGKDVLSQSGSATEVLGNVPSVDVSPSGVVSLRGNSNVTILINGRRSGLTSTEALQQIPSDHIDRVEVITNPSARYDASGTAGIINIILKKNTTGGLSGQVRLVAGVPTDLRSTGSVNYKSEKVNLFSTIGVRYTNYEGFYTKEQRTSVNGASVLLDQYEGENRHDDGQFFYFGADYYINKSNSITAAFLRSQTQDTDDTRINYDYVIFNEKDSTLVTKGDSEEDRDYNQLEMNYTKLFAKEGRKFTIDLQYDFWKSKKNWGIVTESLYPLPSMISNLRTKSDDKNNDIVVQSDFVTPIGKSGQLEIGVKAEKRLVTNGFLAEELTEGDFQRIDGFTNEIDYDEQILGGYVQYGNQFGKFGYLLGIRFEDTDVEIDDNNSNYNRTYSFGKFFPTLNLSYAASENISIQASYSKRIDRPALGQLNPFPQLSDFNSRFAGNPGLVPAFTDAAEISSLFKIKAFVINPSIYYSNTRDIIQNYTLQNEDGIFVTTLINLDQEERMGMEVATSYAPLNWLSFNGEFNIYKYNQEGSYNSQNLDFSDESWYAQLGVKLKPISDYTLQGQFYYQGPNDRAQRKVKSISLLNLGLGKDVLKNKGNVTLKVNNLLNSSKDRETIVGDDFNIKQVSNFNVGPRWTLSFVYKFGKREGYRERRAHGSNRD